MEEVQTPVLLPEMQAAKKQSKMPFLALFAALIMVLGVGYMTYSLYSSYQQNLSKIAQGVLGASSTQACSSPDIQKLVLMEQKRTVSLYAPNKTFMFPISEVFSCITVAPCGRDPLQCKESKVSVNAECIADYLKKNPNVANTTKIMTGEGQVVQVRREDWTVNLQTLAEQLQDILQKGIAPCDFVEGAQVRANLGAIQLSVEDRTPAISENFAERFIEIDRSLGRVYFWNKGIFQTLTATKLGNIPGEKIARRNAVDLSKFLSKEDAEFLQKNTQAEDFVVIHE